MIRGTCPQCGRTFTADDAHAGKTGHCRFCGAEVTLPGRPSEQDHGPAGGPPNAAGTAAAENSPPASPRRTARLQSSLDQMQTPSASSAAEQEEAGSPTRQPPEKPPSPAESEPTASEEPGPDTAEDHHHAEHFGRLSYEPEQGPTALAGPWLRDDAEEQEHDEAPKAEDRLSGKLATPEPEPQGEVIRPALLTVACVVLALLSVAFLGVFALRGGVLGAGVGMLGLALGLLGVRRLSSGHMDGLLPAVAHCACVAGAVLWIVLAPTAEGASPTIALPAGALLAGAGISLALTIAAAMTTSGYLYLHKHS